jgi:hypothetical protein
LCVLAVMRALAVGSDAVRMGLGMELLRHGWSLEIQPRTERRRHKACAQANPLQMFPQNHFTESQHKANKHMYALG